MRRIILLAVLATFLTSAAGAQVLVRVLVSDMDGSEPGTITSATHPSLFVLDPRIESAELTFENPVAPIKNDLGPATWQPALTPFSVTDPQPAGFIELTITPVSGQSVGYGSITYTTSARFASNPSSLRLQFSEDGFASTLSTINMDIERTETVPLTTSTSDAPFSFHWEAHDDFGENGGGEAGFSTNDIIVTETGFVPTLPSPLLILLALALAAGGAVLARRLTATG